MAKVLTQDDWDNIQKEQPSRYYTQSVEDGTLRVIFQSEIVAVEKGDEDSLGNVWEKEWVKNEAYVTVNGSPKLYSLGGRTWSFLREFIEECKNNDIRPEDIPGCVFEITKTGDWTQEIKFVGRDGDVSPTPKEIKIPDDKLKEATDVIKDLKSNSPDLVKGSISTPDFIKILGIRSTINSSMIKSLIPVLEKNGVLSVKDNKISIK